VQNTRHIHNLALVGFMGTGKSSVGRMLAADLHYKFVDTDEMIESRAGCRITEIFAHQGEAVFRKFEGGIVAELEGGRDLVISTGGGLVVNPANLASLKTHSLVVCLWASPEAIWQRTKHQTHRPLLADPDPLGKIRRLLEERDPSYRQADVLVNTESRSIREIAQHVLLQFRNARSQPPQT
jgi:shikimate kinase